MGATPARDAVLTAYAKSLIQFKARQICKKPGFSRSDQDDLVQELILRLLEKAPLYDTSRGASIDTFTDRVVNSSIKMILRDRKREKRAAGFTALSLESPEFVPPLRAILTESDGFRRGFGNTSADTVREDAEAFAHALRSLPPHLVAIAQRLMCRPPAVVARELKLARRRVDAAIQQIRDHFEVAGFSEFYRTPKSATAYITSAGNSFRNRRQP